MRASVPLGRVTLPVLVLLLTLGSAAALDAQQRTVEGRVLGARDSVPVAEAIVTPLGSATGGTRTDAAGGPPAL